GAYTTTTWLVRPANPEYVDSYEFGTKTQWFDRRMTLNLAAFYMKYQDLQVAVFRDAANLLTNAANADIKGVELELVAAPVRGLPIRAAGAYLDARYMSFI